MDFFEQQDRAKRRTTLLLFYYLLAVAGIIVSIYLVIGFMLTKSLVWDPVLLLGTAVGSLFIITTGSVWKIIQLSQGGAAVATMLGGRPVASQTRDASERQLMNVVSEMAIASGLTCPDVYVLDREEGINAFAAGRSPGEAVIGVTRGCMEKLSRDELQGVIGHEFSHILNGDMKLNLRLIGLLAGILQIAMIGYWIMRLTSNGRRSSRRDEKGTAAILLFGLALLVIGYIGVFFAKLIKSAISRQREFLADASSVQFTRNPAGIGGALCKIAKDAGGSRIKDSHAEEASHMFFGNGVSGFLSDLFATHPPIPERLRAIGYDPESNAKPVRPAAEARPSPARPARPPVMGAATVAALLGGTARPQALSVRRQLEAMTPSSRVGSITPANLDYAGQVMAAIPQPIRDALDEPFAARALVLAMLLSPDATIRQKQGTLIQRLTEPGTWKETQQLLPSVAALPIEFRVGTVSLAMPALRTLSPTGYATFRGAVGEVIHADAQTDLFEFTLQKMLFRHLDVHFHRLPPPVANLRSIEGAMEEIVVLLSALARCGSSDPAACAAAFAKGIAALEVSARPVMRDAAQCGIDRIDKALDRLAGLVPARKKRVLDACFAAASSDGSITVWEGELLRAIADTLDCPLPPFAVAQQAA